MLAIDAMKISKITAITVQAFQTFFQQNSELIVVSDPPIWFGQFGLGTLWYLHTGCRLETHVTLEWSALASSIKRLSSPLIVSRCAWWAPFTSKPCAPPWCEIGASSAPQMDRMNHASDTAVLFGCVCKTSPKTIRVYQIVNAWHSYSWIEQIHCGNLWCKNIIMVVTWWYARSLLVSHCM